MNTDHCSGYYHLFKLTQHLHADISDLDIQQNMLQSKQNLFSTDALAPKHKTDNE